MQAHHNAQSHSDEFVMEALVSFDKLSMVVHDLLAYEVGLFCRLQDAVSHRRLRSEVSKAAGQAACIPAHLFKKE